MLVLVLVLVIDDAALSINVHDYEHEHEHEHDGVSRAPILNASSARAQSRSTNSFVKHWIFGRIWVKVFWLTVRIGAGKAGPGWPGDDFQGDGLAMQDLTSHYHEILKLMGELEAQLSDPSAVRDPRKFAELTRNHRDFSERIAAFRDCERIEHDLEQARSLTGDPDPEITEMARAEIEDTQRRLSEARERLQLLLLPRDPNDAKNTIVEIRAGTGGDEATLFASDLFRLYNRYAETRGWKVELLSASASDLGGFKEVIFSVVGEGVYSRLKYEGGTHRVQRVPATETQGRIHTSAVTVAVMPEAEDVDIDIRNEDIKTDTYCSSGPGGQSVNTTYSAVRLTHLPTGLVVTCQDEKSQIKNKAKAMKVLRTRLFDRALQERNAVISAQRKAQVGSGDRSERIRTYNFPQNRLTDHRVEGLTLYNLDRIMEGDLDGVINPLIRFDQAERLKAL